MAKEQKIGEAVKTGIKGFDALVKGGLRRGKTILLSGTPGTGKTIFALQYLYNGAAESGEKGLYISFEERADNLRSQAKQFNWDVEKLEKKGMLNIIEIPPKEIKETTAQEILRLVRKENYSRLVIDSLSALSINIPTTYINVTDVTELSVKRFMYQFINQLKELKETTSILISQTSEGQLSRDGVSEFICDGIILITYESMGGAYSRSLTIRKMREVANDEDIHSLEISKNGLTVHELK